jgi:hypothetical protein
MLCGIGGNKTTQRKLVLLYVDPASGAVDRHFIYERGMPLRVWADKFCRGDGACGKTSLLNVFTRGYKIIYPE